MKIFSIFFTILNQMSFYILIGFLLAGILHSFFPSRIFTKYLSKNNFFSIFLSSFFGVPLPLCSCGVIPTAIGLYREGASKSSVISFLVSTPQVGIDSIIATYSLMGINFAFMRAFLAFIVAIFSGSTIIFFDKEKKEQSIINKSKSSLEEKSFFKKLKEVFYYGFIEMPKDIGKWLLFGLLIAGLITYFIPDNFFLILKNYPFFNMILILAFAVPMYVCATGSIPIACSLIAKGMSFGSAFVFLVAGPATNIASILILLKVFGKKTLFLYLLSLIIGSIILGLSIDYFLPVSWFNIPSEILHVHNTNIIFYYIKILSSVILMALIIYSFFNEDNGKENMYIFSYKVDGMRCNKCKANVYKVFKDLSKETDIYINVKKGEISLNKELDEKILKERIELLGFSYIGKLK